MKRVFCILLVVLGCLSGSLTAKDLKETKSLSDLSCSTSQIAKFNGTEWICTTDETGQDEVDSCPCFNEEQVRDAILMTLDQGEPLDQDCVFDLSAEQLPGPGAFLWMYYFGSEDLNIDAWWYSDDTKVSPYCGIQGAENDYRVDDLTPRQLKACVEVLAEGAKQAGFACHYGWYSQGY